MKIPMKISRIMVAIPRIVAVSNLHIEIFLLQSQGELIWGRGSPDHTLPAGLSLKPASKQLLRLLKVAPRVDDKVCGVFVDGILVHLHRQNNIVYYST